MLVLAGAARADDLSPGVSVTFLERWDVDRLNQILTEEMPGFSGLTIDYTPAQNAVRLYRVTYSSVIPERSNRPTVASGLLAIPDTGETRFPMVSYQHGTVYGKEEVPQGPDEQKMAVKCDMCLDLAGGPACVRACPTGAALRLSPEDFVDLVSTR